MKRRLNDVTNDETTRISACRQMRVRNTSTFFPCVSL